MMTKTKFYKNISLSVGTARAAGDWLLQSLKARDSQGDLCNFHVLGNGHALAPSQYI